MPDIDFQKIELNLIPKKGEQPVVFYASQYETARPFIADLMWGETEFAPGVDCYAEIDIRKNDDNLVVITDDVSIDNNEVSVILPVQAVTCIGKNLGQVKIYAADEKLIAALNFILEVQPDPLAGGVTSETAIDNLTQQIEDIAEEVIGDDYYNKTETDALLADKADKSELPDMTDYYTKTQTDNLLNDKADLSDLATLASKAEVTQAISDEDTALKNWVSSNFATPGYVATYYYTKLQVDDLLFNLMPVGSASGNPCSFDTEIAAELQTLTADIVCGGGGGTPSTPIPLVGHSELNLTRCGVNLLDNTDFSTGLPNTAIGSQINDIISTTRYAYYGITSPKQNVVITASTTSDDYFDEFYVLGYVGGQVAYNSGRYNITSTAVIEDCSSYDYIRVVIGSNGNNPVPLDLTGKGTIQLQLGTTATAYEPYNGQTFTVAFGQTVYGGVYDKLGRLTITWTGVDLGTLNFYGSNGQFYTLQLAGIIKNGSEGDYDHLKCSIFKAVNVASLSNLNNYEMSVDMNGYLQIRDDDYSTDGDFETAMSGIILAYELATPIVIDVDAISVFAENGVNNIISDCGGDVNVSYKDTIQHYIDERL